MALEKGRVERAIRYVRDRFYAAREWKDLADLNRQALTWCLGESGDRKNPDDPTLTVREAWEKERPRLLPLPENPYPTEERVEVSVGKQPYVTFDLNDYSLPHTLVRRTLVVMATEQTVRILDDNTVVATHARTYDKWQQVEDPSHIRALEEEKRAAKRNRGMNRLHAVVPSAESFLVLVAERGGNVGGSTTGLLRLVDLYGAQDVESAVAQAVGRGTSYLGAVRQLLDQLRHARGAPPPAAVELPDDPRVRDLYVQPHPLDAYDTVPGNDREDQEKDDDDESNL